MGMAICPHVCSYSKDWRTVQTSLGNSQKSCMGLEGKLGSKNFHWGLVSLTVSNKALLNPTW